MSCRRRNFGLAAIVAGILGGFIDPVGAVIVITFGTYAAAAGAFAPALWQHRYRSSSITLYLSPITTALLVAVFVHKDTDLISGFLHDDGTSTMRVGFSLLTRASVLGCMSLGTDRLANYFRFNPVLKATSLGIATLVFFDLATLWAWNIDSAAYLTPAINVFGEGNLTRHMIYVPLGIAITVANLLIGNPFKKGSSD
jgi:hypothetical protein